VETTEEEATTAKVEEEGDDDFDWRAELKLMEEENKNNEVTPPSFGPQYQDHFWRYRFAELVEEASVSFSCQIGDLAQLPSPSL